MAKNILITEKPSVAMEFAKVLNINTSRKDGYLEADNWIITWCVGHLVTMSYPEKYDEKLKFWRLDTLPFIPEEYKYEVIPSVQKQFNTIQSLLTRDDVSTIYVATDSGREGEYIYRLVEQMIGVKNKDRKRVWIDSQTEEEIKRGIREAKNQSEYDSLSAMLEAFYNGEVDSIIINELSRSQILDMESYVDFDNNTRVVYQTSYKVENTDKANAVSDITSKPFNVLISGSDTRGGFDENGRSDVIMVATINPKTSTILLTSVPRDFYVTTACDAADGCMQGALDKITHTGIHGTNTTKRTVEQLLGIEINYTFKVGFDTVTDLVDALGGVDVYVEPGYAVTNQYFSVHEGVNHLNGHDALEYARERYAYTEGDRQRTKNQQQVLMGIVNEATKPSVITKYASIMDAMANTFSTTMSNEEISDLIKYQINNNPKWKMEQYMVDGTGDTLMCAELGDAASVMVPDQSTVKLAKDKINAVLAGKSADDVK